MSNNNMDFCSYGDSTDPKRMEALLQSEMRYRTLFNSIDEGFCIIEVIFDENDKPLDYRFLEVSPSFERQTGLVNAQGKRMRELAPEHEEHWFEIYGRIALTGEPARFQNRAAQLHRWYDVYAFRFGPAENRQVGILFNDITERKEADDALRLATAQLELVTATMAIGVTRCSRERRYLWVSAAFASWLGKSPEQIVGRSIAEVIGKEAYETVAPHMDRVLAGERVAYEILVNVEGLGPRWISAQCTPTRDNAGMIDGWVNVIIDITQRKELEEQVARLNSELAARAAELELANRELEAFNYTAAHDLRQPLNLICGYAQGIKALCGEELDPVCLDYVQKTYDACLRMNRLIEVLLTFSALAHVEPRRERVDLSVLARAVADDLKQTEPKLQVEVRIARDLVAHGDYNLLRVVLENLIGNAWKYTGQEQALIEVGKSEASGRTVFFVRDNGRGFDMAEVDQLFLPFRRLPSGELQGGFGIGLATVERIVARHGGKVWGEGESGRGATFYFSLPAQQAEGESCR